ncbi:hypothetical protein [Amycolatopsis sp. NPDC004625]|uniref:hypothetical protein n=1 Tax=Amycolatopsis sp. NPDC004625 TaxID=3154670 RepID=UPI0033A8CE9F
MPELDNPTPAPFAAEAAAQLAIRSARRADIRDAVGTVFSAVVFIGVVWLANRLAFGTWGPVWPLAVLAGVVLPETGRAALYLAAIVTGRVTYTAEPADDPTEHPEVP